MDNRTDSIKEIHGSREVNRTFSSQNRSDENKSGKGADGVDQNTLQQWLNHPDKKNINQDGSYDVRTTEGRALFDAGLIDGDGMPVMGKGYSNADFSNSRS